MRVVEQMLSRYPADERRHALREVMPFVRMPQALAIWSQDYFLALADKVVCADSGR